MTHLIASKNAVRKKRGKHTNYKHQLATVFVSHLANACIIGDEGAVSLPPLTTVW